jgi:uncharacterized protein YegL
MGQDQKIETLNHAVERMLRAFAQEDVSVAEINVAIITFGGDSVDLDKVAVTLPLCPATRAAFVPLSAAGRTPLGKAFSEAAKLIEDRELIPSRAYAPTIVLVSDGRPTDDWEEPLSNLISQGRASKAARFALAIGTDESEDVLKKFSSLDDQRIFTASEAEQIRQFFRLVTMSVSMRSRSTNPNATVSLPFDDVEF